MKSQKIKAEDKIEENENINPSVEIAEENDETEKRESK
jgi:hypothetical protein